MKVLLLQHIIGEVDLRPIQPFTLPGQRKPRVHFYRANLVFPRHVPLEKLWYYYFMKTTRKKGTESLKKKEKNSDKLNEKLKKETLNAAGKDSCLILLFKQSITDFFLCQITNTLSP